MQGKFTVFFSDGVLSKDTLDKDAPHYRRAHRVGAIISLPVFGGLHYRYVRV